MSGVPLDPDRLPDQLAPEMAAVIARMLAEDGPPVDATLLPLAEGRALVIRQNQRWNTELPEMAHVGDTVIAADPTLGSADCRLRILVPHNAGKGAILFVHGGGFAFCTPQTHERCARVLAVEAGLPVVLPDYRLAPEHPFPAGLRDVVASLRGVFEAAAPFGVEPGPLVVSGDSAGANLSLAAMLHEQDRGRPPPAGALLFYGTYDADFDTPSYRRFSDGPGLTRAKMLRYLDWYLPDPAARREPLAAPLHAPAAALRALPPLHLMAAGIDPILSDTLALAERLDALGRSDTLRVVPGVVHGFLQMTNTLEAARLALADAGAAARRMTGPR